MSKPFTIIVTGANRGIGRAICEQILSRPNLPSPITLFAASRSGQNLGFQAPKPGDEVRYPQLDISSSESIRNFVSESGSVVDVLINNAGVNLDAPGSYGPENVRRTLDVNFRGTLEVCDRLLPSLSNSPHGGRIVNLASVASSISAYSPTIQSRIRNASSRQDLEEITQLFESTIPSHKESETGFGPPGRSYSVSKALLRSATNLLAAENPNLLINSCCPGWVSTDMGKLVGAKPPKTPEQGATIPVRLALDNDFDGVSGKYFANDSVRSKETGRVQEWE